ncbi:MAG: hypothetical protein IOD12_18415 [Silvanigrellales bacterium]|nr:hypothetical protein [Silvanigrellales bacterium]
MRTFSCFVASAPCAMLSVVSLAWPSPAASLPPFPTPFPGAPAQWSACPAPPVDSPDFPDFPSPKTPRVALRATIFEQDLAAFERFERRLAGISSVALTTTKPEVVACEDFIGGRLPICIGVFFVELDSTGAGDMPWGTHELAAFVRLADATDPVSTLEVEECK